MLTAHFQMLSRYNSIANVRLYEACAELSDEEYRKHRKGSFGSIEALLNHILLGDRIWMGRLEASGMTTTPPLATILYSEFDELRAARIAEDERIERLFATADDSLFNRELEYVNSKGIHYSDPAHLAATHMFNHQTHHRGQIHVMLSQTEVAPPSLDMHRIIHP